MSNHIMNPQENPAFQVITLGASGGPSEEGVTGFLVKSTSTPWKRGSVLAFDAGTHLAGITKILEQTSPVQPTTPTTPNSSSPGQRASNASLHAVLSDTHLSTKRSPVHYSHFQGVDLPYKSADSNAMWIVRHLVGAYCITHPHLDHLAGLVINTAGFSPKDPPKIIAGLPSTIDAIKHHIFNDVIWPNLSDENNGVGFITYKRLIDSSIISGKIDYKEIVPGLSVQAWPLSHGHCMRAHAHRGSDAGIPPSELGAHTRHIGCNSHLSPGGIGHGERLAMKRKCVYDSSCFFIRDDATGREILMFGDVEPDALSISLPRRNLPVWIYAAEKIQQGLLSTIFIECSFDLNHPDAFLFGHLSPRHLVDELQVLASKVKIFREKFESSRGMMAKKRRTGELSGVFNRSNPFEESFSGRSSPVRQSSMDPESPRSPRDMDGIQYEPEMPHIIRKHSGYKRRYEETGVTSDPGPGFMESGVKELEGLHIVIIHVKNDFNDDRDVKQSILSNLKKLEAQAELGCTFEITNGGQSHFC